MRSSNIDKPLPHYPDLAGKVAVVMGVTLDVEEARSWTERSLA